jgi:enoyl-CoA hydratase/carnithine racemase
MFKDLSYAVSDGIATIAINRPQVLNATTYDTLRELRDAFEAADGDDSARVVVLTGTGRAFCAGTDLSTGKFGRRAGDPSTGEGVPLDEGGDIALRIFRMNKPVIAAINGPAVGFGASILLPADIRIASETARVGFLYARRGICTESCASWFLPRIVGIARAMDWVATGRMLGAAELLAAGLVREVTPAEQLMSVVRLLAREIADNVSPIAVAVSRRLMWRMLGSDHPAEAQRLESRGLTGLGQLSDAAEGAAAFREKRLPRFTGKPSRDLAFLETWWGGLRRPRMTR